MTENLIDTGDVVLHKPTGERWVVACVEGGKLSWCGWPEVWAEVSDCELQNKATEEYRNMILLQMSKMEGSDHRKRYAENRLAGKG